MAWQPPESAKSMTIRPLTKGMVLNQASQAIDDGSFLDLENYITTPEGLKRIPGNEPFFGSFLLPEDPIDLVSIRLESNEIETLLIGTKFLYRLSKSKGFVRIPWSYTCPGSVVVSGTTVTGASCHFNAFSYSTGTVGVTFTGGDSGLKTIVTGVGTAWLTSGIAVNDIFTCGAKSGTVTTITSDTVIEIEDGTFDTTGDDITVGTAYSISRPTNLSAGDVLEASLIAPTITEYAGTSVTTNTTYGRVGIYAIGTQLLLILHGSSGDSSIVFTVYDTSDSTWTYALPAYALVSSTLQFKPTAVGTDLWFLCRSDSGTVPSFTVYHSSTKTTSSITFGTTEYGFYHEHILTPLIYYADTNSLYGYCTGVTSNSHTQAMMIYNITTGALSWVDSTFETATTASYILSSQTLVGDIIYFLYSAVLSSTNVRTAWTMAFSITTASFSIVAGPTPIVAGTTSAQLATLDNRYTGSPLGDTIWYIISSTDGRTVYSINILTHEIEIIGTLPYALSSYCYIQLDSNSNLWAWGRSKIADSNGASAYFHTTLARLAVSSTDWDSADVSITYNFSFCRASPCLTNSLVTLRSGTTYSPAVADTFVVWTCLTASEVQKVTIASVTSDTVLNLESASIPDGTYAAAAIYRSFSPRARTFIDSAVAENKLLIADQKHPLLCFDPTQATGSQLDVWSNYVGYKFDGVDAIPDAVSYFAQRVWIGAIYNSIDGYRKERILWSALANIRNFSIATNYQDLPNATGSIQRIMPMGVDLIIYFDNAIFRGTEYSNSLLPYEFIEVETGGVGVTGPQAVLRYPSGHFFVGYNNIYFLSSTSAPSAIGTPVVKRALQPCKHAENIVVIGDALNAEIIFGFPSLSSGIENLWRYQYQTKAWSYTPAVPTLMANPGINLTSMQWDNQTGTWETFSDTWNATYTVSDLNRQVLLGYNSLLWGTLQAGTTFAGQNISAIFETKDHDFDGADYLKTITRFGLKLSYDTTPIVDIVFSISASTNRGRTWKPCGTIIIPSGWDEGAITFRSIGSNIRFRAVSTTQTTPYTVIEYSLRVRGAGEEVRLGTQE